jgi:hypothetical protein
MAETASEDSFERIRTYAKRVREQSLRFNSEHIELAENVYVGWLDLMGAGHIMATSVQKSANFLARLHVAVEISKREIRFDGKIVPINGLFVVSPNKRALISLLGRAMILLAANFIAVPRPHDRFLLRGGIAFGPVYFGHDIQPGLHPKALRETSDFLNSVMFGPPIIQAYKSESMAPPYGIAVHESARAFAGVGAEPFRMSHWLWWAPNEGVDYPKKVAPLTDLKDCLAADLRDHFDWLAKTMIYHGLEESKIKQWKRQCSEYFSLA